MGGSTLKKGDEWDGWYEVPAPGLPRPRTGETAGPEPDRPGPGRVPVVVLGLALALLLAGLEQTITTAALPAIAGDLHGLDAASWLLTAPLLATAVGLPVYGKLGDLFGRKPVLICAVLLCVVGAALAGRARDMEQLIIFRSLQGLGAGGLVAGAQAVAADLASARRRGRLLGPLGAALALGCGAGPVLGGYLVEHASWRWCFLTAVPLGLAALAVLGFALRLPEPARNGTRRRPDVLGALLLAAFSTFLVLLAGWSGTAYAWDSQVVVGLGAGALGTVLLFVAVEFFVTDPLVPLRLFLDPVFVLGGVLAALTGVALYAVVGYLPLLLQLAHGVPAAEAGLWVLPLAGGAALACLVIGPVISRTGGYRLPPPLGCALAAAGMWLLSRVGAVTGPWGMDPGHTVLLGTGLLGAGAGLVLTALLVAVQNSVHPTDLGVATSAQTYARQIGGAAGAAVLGALLAGPLGRRLDHALPEAARLPGPQPVVPQAAHALPAALRDGLSSGAQAVSGLFLWLVPVLVLAFLLALFLKAKPLSYATRTPHVPTGDPAGSQAATAPFPRTAHGPEEAADPHNVVAPPPQGQPLTSPYAPHGQGPAPDRPGSPEVPHARAATARRPESPAYERDAYERDAYEDDPYEAARRAAMAGVPVCGTVRHHDGTSVPRAALTLIDVAGRQVGRGATGEDGRYALGTPGAGAYVLIAAAGGHQPRAVGVTVGERPVELDVVLGGAGRLAGAVTTADGTPVRDALVTLTDVRGEVVASTRSGREGGYVITELVAGEYTLASSAPAFRPAALPVTVQSSRETRQDIELAGGAVLRGTVRAGGGRAVGDARVTLLDAAGNVVDTVTTGPDGQFRFVDLAAGEYTVIAAGYPPVATVLHMAGGGRTERDLHLGYED
ncbi:MFS transporter [Streptomyces sp. NPDC003077]|uniref:MFS transporter n=1 Tax=Streptomyces sp. NPDC003077 TaxID=3154443 RepID=UPI0033B164A1